MDEQLYDDCFCEADVTEKDLESHIKLKIKVNITEPASTRVTLREKGINVVNLLNQLKIPLNSDAHDLTFAIVI